MTALDRATAAQRREALRVEREAQRRLTEAYKAILARLQGDLDALTTRVAAAEAAGETVGASWLGRDSRYRALIAQTEAEIGRYSRNAETTIANGQRQAATAALGTSEAVMAAALGTPPPGVVATFNRLPTGAIEELVGNLGDGRPLSGLLDGLGAEASKAGRAALIEALGKGLSPRQLAIKFRVGTNESAVSALRISRQEINRAYRDASLANYRANGDVVTGWRWLCAGGKRTCGLCYAMSGKEFKLDQPFASHPQCRCTVTPVCREIPGYQSPSDPADGPTVFGRLSEEDQRAILGPGKYGLFKSGDMSLDDLVQGTRSAAWGPGRRERTLAEVRAAANKRATEVPRVFGPSGKPVADALTLPKGKNGTPLQTTLDAIGKVHGDGELPPIPIESTASRGRQGAYWHDPRIGSADKITISRNADNPAFTLAHEIGHFLDHQGINGGQAGAGAFASLNVERAELAGLREWEAAIKASRARKEMIDMAARGKVEVTLPDGITTMYDVDSRYILRYALDGEEQFARSYAQYIAVRSGDPTLLEGLNAARNREAGQVYYATQWDDDDFEPIARALDTLFAGLGWLK